MINTTNKPRMHPNSSDACGQARIAIRVDGGQPTPLLSAKMTLSEMRDQGALFASIKTMRQYDRLVYEGFTRISQSYASQRILYPHLEDFRAAHTRIFAQVSAEAGRIRDEECIVQIFGSICENWDLEGEFKLLEKQISVMVAAAQSLQDKVVIIAFTHARIVAMQPALFGNKRTAMCLTLAQARALLNGVTKLPPFDIMAYYSALDGKINADKSVLLNSLFGEILGIKGFFNPAPFVARCGCYHPDRWHTAPDGVLKSSRILSNFLGLRVVAAPRRRPALI